MRTLLVTSLALLLATSTLAAEGSQNAPASVSSTLVYRDGHVTYTVVPRVPEGGRLLMLLGFPAAPQSRPLAPAAVDALHALAALEPSPEASERATPSSAELSGTSVIVISARGDLEEWWQTHGAELEDEVLERGMALVQRGWKVLVLSGDHTSPALAFRFQAERPLVPLDLLRPDHQRAQELHAASGEAADESGSDNRVLRLLNKVWGD